MPSPLTPGCHFGAPTMPPEPPDLTPDDAAILTLWSGSPVWGQLLAEQAAAELRERLAADVGGEG